MKTLQTPVISTQKCTTGQFWWCSDKNSGLSPILALVVDIRSAPYVQICQQILINFIPTSSQMLDSLLSGQSSILSCMQSTTSWLDMKFQIPSEARIIHGSVAGFTYKFSVKNVRTNDYLCIIYVHPPQESAHQEPARSFVPSEVETCSVCRHDHLKKSKVFKYR